MTASQTVDPTPQTRSATLAGVALALAGAGVLVLVVGLAQGATLALTIAGGVLSLAGLLTAILALASPRHGGTALGIAGVGLAAVGSMIFAAALVVTVVFAGLGSAAHAGSDARPAPPVATATTGPYDEQAYLAQVRPAVIAVVTQMHPELSEHQISSVYTDDTLISIGSMLLAEYSTGGDQMLQREVDSLVDSGTFDEDSADRFVSVVLAAAQEHLQASADEDR